MNEQDFLKKIVDCRDKNIVIDKVLDKNSTASSLLELTNEKDTCLSFLKENENYFIKKNMNLAISHTIKRINSEKMLIESATKDIKSKESFVNIIKNIEVRKEELSHWKDYLSETAVKSRYSYNIMYFIGLIFFIGFIVGIIKKQVK